MLNNGVQINSEIKGESFIDFDSLSISIASPQKILSWSYGEIKNSDTINYRTFKPERDGLFCARIFGPIKDYECLCGKYKRRKYKGIKCEKCEVEVASSRVRRDRMGHINLVYPAVNILYLKSIPSKISILLNVTTKDLEKVIYFEKYIVCDPGNTYLTQFQVLTEEDYNKALDEFGQDAFTAGTGAESLRQALKSINLKDEYDKMKVALTSTKSELRLKNITRRMQLLEDFINSNNSPECIVMTVLPVLPPELRPLVPLDGGKLAISDLNLLYARVINRNNRLKRLMEMNAPELILRNERRMLQDAVSALFNNSIGGARVAKNSLGKPLKSISDFLRGKQGRFRQNLLGKRVDYSGRSVIIVGPELKLHQCGLPKKMALELFKPFVLSKLRLYGKAATIKAAYNMIEVGSPEVWDALEEVIREHPVLLNRAPTLHRLGIQAFEPKLAESKAIQLHPLVCRAFNADFDGDQMAVHVPLSIEAQVEARILMMSSNNILSSANGAPVVVPRKDMTAGLYYMTLGFNNEPGNGRSFFGYDEVIIGLDNKVITVNSKIKYNFKYHKSEDKEFASKLFSIETTPGRVKLFNLLPQDGKIEFESLNFAWDIASLNKIVQVVYDIYGRKVTVIFCDKIMNMGFAYATICGLSIGKDDIVIPKTKQSHINNTMLKIKETEEQYASGYITQKEKFNKVTDCWSECSNSISKDMMNDINSGRNNREINSLLIMMNSGARASEAQMRQLAGMRGLIVRPSGGIIETPVLSNFKEGLSVLEYFNSAHGARKGNVDTALKTADAGYLTRRLVDVAQDCIVTQEDCGTDDGIVYAVQISEGKVTQPLSSIVYGRVLSEDVFYQDDSILFKKGEILDHKKIKLLEHHGVTSVKVRSAVTCNARFGICAQCYGVDLATNNLVNIGEAVGIIAAQSIGEPGTQLTLNTFHIGGTASKQLAKSSIEAEHSGKLQLEDLRFVIDKNGEKIVCSYSSGISIVDSKNKVLVSYKIEYGSTIYHNNGDIVKLGEKLAEWDPYNAYIISEHNGFVKFNEMTRNVSYVETVDNVIGKASKVIISTSDIGKNFRPSISIVDSKGEAIQDSNSITARYFLTTNMTLSLSDGDQVFVGDRIAKIAREGFGIIKDITGGLPRVEEIFEARLPKEPAVVAGADGYIEFNKSSRIKTKITLHPDDNSIDPIVYSIAKDRYISVRDGGRVQKGDIIIQGDLDPHDILAFQGIGALTRYIVKEIQTVYRLQGIEIDNKHIEIIVKYMLNKVLVIESGDTGLTQARQYDVTKVRTLNKLAIDDKKVPAKYTHILYGITKASMYTESFISAASFQETMKVLTDAAVKSKKDELRGMKENIIIGRLIPAGTGYVLRKIKEQAKQASKE
jgi:DNA-directed RNA polymerase subunit beta'